MEANVFVHQQSLIARYQVFRHETLYFLVKDSRTRRGIFFHQALIVKPVNFQNLENGNHCFSARLTMYMPMGNNV